MNDLWQLLGQDKAVRALTNREKGLSQVPVNAESLIIAASFKQQKRLMVVVKNNLYTAQQLFRKLTPLLQEDVLLFSVEESLRVEAVASTPTMYADQMETLTDICLHDRPRVIITHPTALVRYLPSPETF
ncbi:MAG: transcription-repair coupling factor, partial [Erysipelotrichaceae bacterium]|nr:transcription-repair coupling factor [Erysipelotrichaceae bacterium]